MASSAKEQCATYAPEKWWKIHLFRGLWRDLKRRAPYYASDFTDAWDYRVIPAIIYMLCANILPALAFSLDLFSRTNTSYGVNETLLASVVGCVVFGLFAAQPLVIAGVTGPITVFNYTIYDIITPLGIPYLPFMGWVSIWAAILHWILAITNACNGLRYVTKSFGDTFGFYVATLYIQKGIQILIRQFDESSQSAAFLSIMLALLMVIFGYGGSLLGVSTLFRLLFRTVITDYTTVLALIFFSGFSHIGIMREAGLAHLPTTVAYEPTLQRSWWVPFYELNAAQTFLALPFAVLLTALFYFDHNISSLIAQGTGFPLRKPAGFHWDFALLGLTTLIAGFLGLPAPNGLIPQAPFHTASLCVRRSKKGLDGEILHETEIVRVVEQRVSNTAQGLIFLFFMTGPLLLVLGLIPRGVLAGLFFIMALQAYESNGITETILFLCRDKSFTPRDSPLSTIRRQAVWAFLAYQLIGYAATLAISETIAAIGFPVVIILMVPIRAFLLPKYFSLHELSVLDKPVASDFTAESFGGMIASLVVEEKEDSKHVGGERIEVEQPFHSADNGPAYNIRRREGSASHAGGPKV